MLSQIQTKTLFKQGNYTQVALFGNRECWEKYAAFALIGKTSEAVNYFRNCDDFTDAYFYEGVAHWMNGDDELAYRALGKVNNLHAQNLLRLIQKDKIHVLAQVPWIRNHFTDWLAGVSSDPKFQVNNISFHPDDIPNKPYAGIHQFYDSQKPPDFYVCQMVEWHLIPPDIQELSCPLFGQTADYDLHIQAVYPWLQLFDELLVTDGTEWNDVSKLVSVPVSTFPKSFCLLKDLPELQLKSREIDLYLSGTVTHPYHPDKANLLSQILRIPELNIKVVHGFTGADEYYENLSNSKVCFTYVRHPGATPTRGLEALSLGCALIVQEESVLRLFVGKEEGVLTYNYDKADLANNLIHIAQNWLDYQWKAYKGAQVIREEFSTEKIASQFLRYLTFLAAKPKVTSQRKKANHNRLFQKRTVLQKGWLPSYNFEQSEILKGIYQANLLRLENIKQSFGFSSEVAINTTREITLFHYHCTPQNLLFAADWVKDVEQIYREASDQFPQSLVLQFNLFRTLVHFGSPAQVSQAINTAIRIIEKPLSYWIINEQEDVLPYDIFDNFFNYRSYFDCLVENLKSKSTLKDKLIKLILASIHHYLGLYIQNSKYLETAFTLDPDFATYRMSYLKREIKKNRSFLTDKKLKGILLELSQGSTEFPHAYQLIQEQASIGNIEACKLLETEIRPIYVSIKVVENSSFCLLRPSIEKLINPFKDIDFTKEIVHGFIKTSRDSILRKVQKIVKDNLNVNVKDIILYSSSEGVTKELLLQRIRDMKRSKFLYFLNPISRAINIDELRDLKVEDLISEIRRLESTPAWKLRTDWFKVKYRIRKYLTHLRRFYINPTSNCYSGNPKLIGSTQHYNFVLWKKSYYGIPKFLGNIDLHKVNLDDYSMIVSKTSLQALKRHLKRTETRKFLSRFLSRLLDFVKEEDCKPYTPSSSTSKVNLLKQIYKMKHSIFMVFADLKFNPDTEVLFETMTTEMLLQAIHKLEATRGGRLRIYVSRLKWSIRSLLIRLLDINPLSYFPTYNHRNPILLESLRGYNLIIFDGAFYGVPLALGDVRLENIEFDDGGTILFDTSLKSLKKRINQGKILYCQPTLLESRTFYNIVAWGKSFYGVPTILGDLELDRLTELLNTKNEAVILDNSLAELRRRVRNCELICRLKSLAKPEDLRPYHPPGDLNKNALLAHIRSMMSSKFLLFESNRFDLAQCAENSKLITTELMMAEIRRLEQARAWRLRTNWFRVKWKLLNLIIRIIEK